MTLHWSVFQSPVKTGHEFNLITTLILTSAIPPATTTAIATDTTTTTLTHKYHTSHTTYETLNIDTDLRITLIPDLTWPSIF